MPGGVQHIGPPHAPFRGMNTSQRRQNVAATEFVKARNVVLSGGALQRRPGLVRLMAGTRTAKSVSCSSGGLSACTLTNVADYDLGAYYSVFVSYRPTIRSLPGYIASDGNSGAAWRITHNANRTITGRLYDGTTTLSLTTTRTFGNRYIEVGLVRAGTTGSLYINGTLEKTQATLSATASATGGRSVILGTYGSLGSQAIVRFYEFRLFRTAVTDQTWRSTQYPWSGKFGDPNLAAHLTFEDGTGTTVTDHSRNGNNATLAQAWTWNSATERQVVTPITGLHVFENARGRKWLLVEAGTNHYRIALN